MRLTSAAVMRTGWSRAIALSGIAAVLALAEAVWVVVLLDGSSDGPAFAMALLPAVVIPTLLAASGVTVIPPLRRRPRSMIIAAVAAVGFGIAGIEAGVFVADEPADPAWIHAAASSPPVALLAAAVLAAVAAWDLWGPMPVVLRIAITGVVAVLGPILLALVLLIAGPLIVLLAIVAPFGYAGAAVLADRRRRDAT